MKAIKLKHHLERKLISNIAILFFMFVDKEVLGSFNWLPSLVDNLIALNFKI